MVSVEEVFTMLTECFDFLLWCVLLSFLKGWEILVFTIKHAFACTACIPFPLMCPTPLSGGTALGNHSVPQSQPLLGRV